MILIPVTKAAASTAPFTRIGLPVRPDLARGFGKRIWQETEYWQEAHGKQANCAHIGEY